MQADTQAAPIGAPGIRGACETWWIRMSRRTFSFRRYVALFSIPANGRALSPCRYSCKASFHSQIYQETAHTTMIRVARESILLAGL